MFGNTYSGAKTPRFEFGLYHSLAVRLGTLHICVSVFSMENKNITVTISYVSVRVKCKGLVRIEALVSTQKCYLASFNFSVY